MRRRISLINTCKHSIQLFTHKTHRELRTITTWFTGPRAVLAARAPSCPADGSGLQAARRARPLAAPTPMRHYYHYCSCYYYYDGNIQLLVLRRKTITITIITTTINIIIGMRPDRAARRPSGRRRLRFAAAAAAPHLCQAGLPAEQVTASDLPWGSTCSGRDKQCFRGLRPSLSDLVL